MKKVTAFLASLSLSIFISFSTNVVEPLAQTKQIEQQVLNQTRSVISDQLNAFQNKDHARAFSHAAPNIKNMFGSVDRFITMVQKGYPAIYAPDSFAFGRSTSLNGEMYHELLVTDAAGKQWQAIYTLKQQVDGSWKITGVKINPNKGTST